MSGNRPAQNRSRIQFLAQFGILLAIEAIFCFTPLGSLPSLGMIVMTLALLPVLVTAILMGTAAGTLMGFFTGLFSFLVWTFTPPNPLTAFVFTPFYSLGDHPGNMWSLVICFVPRILAGTVTGLLFQAFRKMNGDREMQAVTFGLSGLMGSLVNTFGVLGGIFVFFGQDYFSAMQAAPDFLFKSLINYLMFVVLTNGFPEAVLGFLAAYFVCRPIWKYQLNNRY